MTTAHQLAVEFTERMNRETERKKMTVRRLLRFGWAMYSYLKGPPVIEGDLSTASNPVAIQALSKQILSGFQDVKLDSVTTEGIDFATGLIMDLIRPSEMHLESQLGMLMMLRGVAGPTMMPMGMPAPPPPAYGPPPPAYGPPPPTYVAPRPPLVGPPGAYGGSYPAPRYQPPPFTGRIANQDGAWVYVANDG